MVGGGDIRHPITTEKQRVFPLTGKGTDQTLGNQVVDTVTTLFQVGEELIAEMMQVIHRIVY